MKLPYIQFYPGDWMKDPHLSLCSPATRGVWIDLICSFHESRTGQASGTPEQLARLCRCSAREMTDAITELTMTHTAEIEDRGGVFTIACRRMRKEVLLSKARSEAAKQRFSKANAKTQQIPEDEYEDEVEDRVGIGEECEERKGEGRFACPSVGQCEFYCSKIGLPVSEVPKFIDYYESKGWKVGKAPMKNWQAAMRNWKRNWECNRGNINGAKTAAERDLERVLKGV